MFKYKILVLLLRCTVLWTRFSPPTYACTSKCKESSVHGTKSSLVCQNIISSVLLLYCEPFSSDLCLYYKCKEFSVHGIKSSVVFQNIIITAVLEIFEFRVSSKLFTGVMMEKENICIPGGIENVGLFLHYIGV